MSMHMSMHMFMHMSMHMSMHIAVLDEPLCMHLTACALLAHVGSAFSCDCLSVLSVPCQQHFITLDDTVPLVLHLCIHMAANFIALSAASHSNIADSFAWNRSVAYIQVTKQPALTGHQQRLTLNGHYMPTHCCV